MRLGWVATADQSVRLREIGYDYIEMHLAPFGLEDAASLSNAKQRTCDLALPCEVLSLMFPRDLRLVGDAPMLDRARRYLGFATELMVHLRAEIVVYGSGWVRNLPSGFDAGRREQQYIESLNLIADCLAGSGAVCAIEPLNRKESDIANSVDEAVHYASLVNRREIKVLADFFHMQEEREPIETVVRNAKWLSHVHVADTGRRNPGSGTYPYASFAAQLRLAGYDRRVTTECVANDERHMRESYLFLRRTFP